MSQSISPAVETKNVLNHLEPREVLGLFEVLANIPRGSGNEAQAAEWVVAYATELGLEAKKDDLNCVLVKKPGQLGLENAAPLILHGHLDMVCEKAEGVDFDFINQPIDLLVEGDFITANGTSLGADNGIGVSYILALLASTDTPHPPLEAVLTAMEEKGKVGAGQFDTTQLKGRRMIDFNWITDKEILAGCSGDVTFHVDIPAEYTELPASHSVAYSLKVRGLNGGHCEFDIQLERANALQVLARAIDDLQRKLDIRIDAPYGGAQNNAIPMDAEAVVTLAAGDQAEAKAIIARLETALKDEYDLSDPNVRLEFDATSLPSQVYSDAAGKRFSRVTSLIPNAVITWNTHVPGRVASSNNLGTARPIENGVRLASTITASITSKKHEILQRVEALAALAGGGVTVETFGLDAPEFPYRPDSELLATATRVYREVMGSEPNVEVSQCSLELGMFSNRVPVADIISIGTELHALHSPAEKVNHTSVAKVWPLVKAVVAQLG
ncbi:MAG: beta-Ala-His dipeptidase [Micrococcales bacterium]